MAYGIKVNGAYLQSIKGGWKTQALFSHLPVYPFDSKEKAGDVALVITHFDYIHGKTVALVQEPPTAETKEFPIILMDDTVETRAEARVEVNNAFANLVASVNNGVKVS